jgi:hypothetical protein
VYYFNLGTYLQLNHTQVSSLCKKKVNTELQGLRGKKFFVLDAVQSYDLNTWCERDCKNKNTAASCSFCAPLIPLENLFSFLLLMKYASQIFLVINAT